jgi:drug/metabolite transporter (DMT)-like permease
LSIFVLGAVLLAALFHATWNALLRAQPDRTFASQVVAIFTGLFGIPFMIALPLPAPEAWPYILASSFIHVGYFALVGFAYRSADLGVAYPLTRGSAPLLTAVFAFFLVGEALGLNGWLAIVLIGGGIAALSIDALMSGGLTRQAALAVATNAVVIMAYTLIDGLGIRVANGPLSYAAWLVTCTSFYVLVLALLTRRRAFFPAIKKIWLPGLLAGALVLPSYAIALWAMTRAPIGLVAALRETSVLFAGAIGAYCFGEKFGPRRWIAVVLIVGGIILLKLPAL